MSCYLRAKFSSKKAMDEFLAKTKLTIAREFRKGQPRFPKSKRNKFRSTIYGVNICAVDADWGDLKKQVSGAIRYLEKNGSEVRKLVRASQKGVTMDFALQDRNQYTQNDRFPARLLKVLSKFEVDLEVSYYRYSRP